MAYEIETKVLDIDVVEIKSKSLYAIAAVGHKKIDQINILQATQQSMHKAISNAISHATSHAKSKTKSENN